MPDVTLRPEGGNVNVGLAVASSRNRLLDLRLERFAFGVVLQQAGEPLPTRQTFAGNTVSGLVLDDIRDQGVVLDPTALGNCGVPCRSRNTWLDTTITGNIIESRAAGIVFWIASTGERVRNVTVTDNNVTITGRGEGSGIAFETAGPLGGRESTGARISDVLVARNTVRGSPDIGIGVSAGTGRAKKGTIERVRVLANRLHLVGRRGFYCCQGIAVQAGADIAEFAQGPPVRYLDDNAVREVVVRGNRVTGTLEWGVSVFAGWGGGGRRNQIHDVRIERNVLRSSKPMLGVFVVTGSGESFRRRQAMRNRISSLTIDRNEIAIGRGVTSELAGGGIGAAGVALVGGHKLGRANVVRDVRITRNTIRSTYEGVKLIGGLGPTARGNRVVCVVVSGNRVTGTRQPLSVAANVAGARGNRASLGAC